MEMNVIQLCIDSLTADVADKVASDQKIGTTEALRQFMETKTYDLLFDTASFLYLESTEYVYDMLQAEQRGDWESWLEV